MRALAIAATGMSAQQTNVEVIANNIANINTTGYKRSRAEFTDLLYQAERIAGTPNRGGQDAVPEGGQIGLGTRTAAVRNLHLQGSLDQYRQQARSGAQWARLVPGSERQRRQPLHPRRRLQQERHRPDRDRGRLCGPAGDDDSHRTQPTSSSTRRDRFTLALATTSTLQIDRPAHVANFANDAGLDPLGGNLYRETAASGTTGAGRPGRSWVSDPCSKAISRIPTSTRSRRSPSSSRRSAPTR